MEGWYANEDGTFSISFGYLNANSDTMIVPLGPDNFIEPAQFDGLQPTVFVPGHQRGLFAVTLPADMEETDVWWTIRKPNGDVSRVPGRIGAVAYQLDWFARPHGSMHPLVSFDGQNGDGRGPPGLMADRVESPEGSRDFIVPRREPQKFISPFPVGECRVDPPIFLMACFQRHIRNHGPGGIANFS